MAATVVTAAISPRQLISDSSDQGTGSAGGHHPVRSRGLPVHLACRHRSRRAHAGSSRLRLLPRQARCVPHRGRPGCQRGSHSRRASGCGCQPGGCAPSRSTERSVRAPPRSPSASSRSCCSCSCLRSSPGLREMHTAPAPGPGPGDGGLHSTVATALAGVVSLANRLSLQPAR